MNTLKEEKKGKLANMTDAMSKIKRRIMREAVDSIVSAGKLTERFEEVASIEDIQALRSAANQARQAAMSLDQLCGLLEAESCLRK